MKESRLIGRTSSDFNDPTKYNSRIAEANAVAQQNTRDAALNSVTRTSYGNNVPTNVAPSTMGNVSNPWEPTATGTSGNFQVNTNPGGTGILDEARTVYGAQAAGQNVVQERDAQGNPTSTVAIPDGNIALNAYNRMTGDNNLGVDMSAQDAAKKLNDPSYKAGIRTATNGVGTAGVDIRGYSDTSQRQWTPATGMTRGDYEAQTTEMEKRNTEAMKQDQLRKENEKKTATDGTASTAASAAATEKTSKPKDPEASVKDAALLASVASAMQGLPGGELVMQGLQAALQDSAAAKAEAYAVNDMQKDQARDAEEETQSFLDKFAARYKENRDASQKFAKEIRDETDQLLAENQARDQEKLAWQQQMDTQKAEKLKTDEVTKMSIGLAMGGGFGSRAGLDQVASAEAEWNKSILNLQKEYAFKKADVGAFYTEKYVQAQQTYRSSLSDAAKDYDNKLDGLEQQGFASSQARKLAESKADTDLITALGGIRKDHAATVKGYISEVNNEINRSRDDQRAQEETALNRIDYLLKNYPRESVAEAIKELGAKVTSFDVQALIDNPTLAEITRAEAAMKKRSSGGGGGYATSFLPAGMQEPPKPEVSLDDFMQQKMTALESAASQSFAPAKRAELMAQNADKWEKEHEAIYMSGPTGAAVGQAKSSLVQQFGQTVVDAAQLVMDGTYTGTDPVGKAAKAMGVPASQVATALTKLKQTGAVAETAILSPAQQKSRDTIISGLKTDPFYTVWNGSKSAVTRINAAIGDNGGADGLSDIMAINAFQNGIVDPGSTVKEGDVSLMQTAIAWADLVQLNYWKEKISDGDKLPASMRQKMLQLATSTRDAYGQDFQAETVPRVRSLIQQNGLPPTVLNEYLGSSTTTVSPAVSSFVDSLQF